VPNPRFGELPSRDSDEFFQTASRRSMAPVPGDPFLASLVSGVSEGELVLKDRKDGVPVYGPPLPSARFARFSDREMHMLRLKVGGAFNRFFNDLFGKAGEELTAAQGTGSTHEENPFQRAREALAQTSKSDPGAGAKTDTTSSQELSTTSNAGKEARSAKKETVPATKPAVGPSTVQTVRPYFMLRLTDDGVLHAIPMSQPREGIFESVEFGIQEFTTLAFTDAPDFPMAIAVADFNGDGRADISFHVAQQPFLRFLYASADGTYSEGMRIQIGAGPRSVAAGDFNRDGYMDLALSAVGPGMVTILHGQPDGTYRFKATWLDVYRDYVLAADLTGTGNLSLVGMNFANRGIVLMDFSQTAANPLSETFEYSPASSLEVSTAKGRSARLNAVVLSNNLAVNLDNRQRQMTNVLNVAAGFPVNVVLGDLNNDGSLLIGLATPKKN